MVGMIHESLHGAHLAVPGPELLCGVWTTDLLCEIPIMEVPQGRVQGLAAWRAQARDADLLPRGGARAGAGFAPRAVRL